MQIISTKNLICNVGCTDNSEHASNIDLLPIQLVSFMRPIKNMFSKYAAIQNGFFILAFGLTLILIYNKGKIRIALDSVVCHGLALVIRLIIVSLVASLLLYVKF